MEGDAIMNFTRKITSAVAGLFMVLMLILMMTMFAASFTGTLENGQDNHAMHITNK